MDDELKTVGNTIGRMIGRMIVPDDTLNKIFEESKDWATRYMKKEGELSMMITLHGFHALSPSKDKVLMPALFADWPPPDFDGKNGKMVAMLGLGAKFAEEFPTHLAMCAVHMSEVWMAQHKPGDPEEDKFVAPSQRSNRVEGLIIHASTIDGRTAFATFEIVRYKNGKFKGLEPLINNPYNAEDEPTTEDYLTRYVFRGFLDARQNARKPEAKDV